LLVIFGVMRGRSRKPHGDGADDGDAADDGGGRPHGSLPQSHGVRSVAQAQDSIAAALRSGRPNAGDSGTGSSGLTHGFVLYSRSGALSNREVLDRNVGLPRSRETVEHYANLAGVDFRDVLVEIMESADDVAYLDFQGAVARTDPLGVQLGPAAFQNEETLVRTLGHESVHVRQHQEGQISTMTGPLEDEAYEAEDGFVAAWRSNRS
jgi:hypothetical protein